MPATRPDLHGKVTSAAVLMRDVHELLTTLRGYPRHRPVDYWAGRATSMHVTAQTPLLTVHLADRARVDANTAAHDAWTAWCHQPADRMLRLLDSHDRITVGLLAETARHGCPLTDREHVLLTARLRYLLGAGMTGVEAVAATRHELDDLPGSVADTVEVLLRDGWTYPAALRAAHALEP